MKIKAKFKGADGSLGYRNGANYFLFARIENGRVLVHRGANAGLCAYASFKALLNNWQILN